MFIIFIKGMFLGASLIIAIGLQNAFILRQGIKRQHVLPAVLTASIIDVLLIGTGVLGFGFLIEQYPQMIVYITWGGAAFLIFYGLKSFMSAFQNKDIRDENAKNVIKHSNVKDVVLIITAISLLNPHVYLDTVVLIGGLSASYGEIGKYYFGGGAMLASFLWFFALGYGARLLTPIFEKPRAWQILDILIGLTMWGIALSLLLK